ncbi:MAG: hypothetical protein CMA81_03430 [Euryarchaeota archaeon]|nr:hypothetical protein [Euryarchaeota archaeon]|tara:strand:+ start:4135 stop:5022 length:888 start_codon:yes stop_codon:yes gene_type:complete
MNQLLNSVHELLLGKEADLKVRRLSLIFAITGFLLHLLLWLAYKMEVLDIGGASPELLDSPLDALYTPFSVLLAYEVYQLIRAIPESFSTAVGKQFEIVTLLVVRDIFKQLSDLDFSGGWSIDSELKFIIVECFTFVILFITSLIYRANSSTEMKLDFQNEDLVKFVQNKRIISLFLLGTYAIIALFSFTNWCISISEGDGSVTREIFFLDFFTVLILADILILLISYGYSIDFTNLARNTGFILSTVVLRVAISAGGLSSTILFMLGGLIGIAVLVISLKFEGFENEENYLSSE